MGCPRSLVKAVHCGIPDTTSLDIDSRVLQQFFYGDRATSFLGIGRILVLLVRHAALGHRLLRSAPANVIVRFRA